MLALQKIGAITVSGLSDQVRSELLASLPIHEGDAPTAENMAKLRDAVKQFDEHLLVSSMRATSTDAVAVRIVAPGAEPEPRIAVGGKVQEANIVKKVDPVYPALAKATRIQGHVVLAIVIGKDGSVQEITLVTGHPLLAPAAIEAVKQWTYKPTLLNGQPVEVNTQVDISFTLQD
jgi:TonB family protein